MFSVTTATQRATPMGGLLRAPQFRSRPKFIQTTQGRAVCYKDRNGLRFLLTKHIGSDVPQSKHYFKISLNDADKQKRPTVKNVTIPKYLKESYSQATAKQLAETVVTEYFE